MSNFGIYDRLNQKKCIQEQSQVCVSKLDELVEKVKLLQSSHEQLKSQVESSLSTLKSDVDSKVENYVSETNQKFDNLKTSLCNLVEKSQFDDLIKEVEKTIESFVLADKKGESISQKKITELEDKIKKLEKNATLYLDPIELPQETQKKVVHLSSVEKKK